MRLLPKSILSIAFCCLVNCGFSQELNFSVSINADQVQTTERDIFVEMESAFERFLNDQTWTNDNYRNNEKIKGNIILTIRSQPSIGSFVANAQIQVIRPVYGTNYETLLLNFADRDWEFTYTESQPLIFNENVYLNNISSLLSYYAYLSIGLDYDSFSLLGGTDYFDKAFNVVNNAQQSGKPGWRQFENTRNRYWLMENLNVNNQYRPVREAIYFYHLQGIDLLKTESEICRNNILQALKDMQSVNRILPNSIIIRSFFDSKSDELLNIFSEGPINVRRDVYNELLKLDPARSAKYRQIVAN